MDANAYTMNPLAIYYAQYDDSIQYDYIECEANQADAKVAMIDSKINSDTLLEHSWFFRRDTMTKNEYDSALRYQEMHSRSPTAYIVGKCHQQIFIKDILIQDSLVECGESPILLPRKSHRAFVAWNGVAYFEFYRDTSYVIRSERGERKVSAKIWHIETPKRGNRQPKPKASIE